ncbi:MAG TPA: beta-ketoacyl-ACP synthase 3 [Solirubrobacterales bacterium]|nr:beta-ketoacyl-ACP synthase 3 [Solirubrobacterales bacterium]
MPELAGPNLAAPPGAPAAAAIPVVPVAPRSRAGAEIAGLGIALPAHVETNAPIAARLGIDAEWIAKRTGIEERRIAAPGERLFELGAAAAERALLAAGVSPGQIDLVIVATTSNDELMPGASPRVAAAIGAAAAGAIDLNAACTGFVSALSVACGQIESGRAEHVLVVGADLMSRITDPADRNTSCLFADGAGAVVMRGAAAGRIGPVVLGADGANADLLRTPRETGVTEMQGHETFKHAVDRMSEVTLQALDASGLTLADVDVFVYHQANARILRSVGERLGLDPARVLDCIGKYGNTSAASIPVALEEARLAGGLDHGARVLIAAFGAGLTWGATVVEWGTGE